uniref:SCAN box domain-containing protein n=1 Tax=Cyprinus carpio carpio TaxID=630221 RepID=A0A9J8CI30_CYPCA
MKVQESILDKFEINSEPYRQRFRSHSLRENESAKELQVRLKDLYEKWMNPRHRTKEEVGDQIILEQFLKLLNPETRMWVKQNNPTSSKQAAEMAENFMAARRSVSTPC